MIDTKTAPAQTDLDAATLADLEAISKSVTDNYTLADALRDGSKKVTQVHDAWESGEGTGCALTAIYTAAISQGINV